MIRFFLDLNGRGWNNLLNSAIALMAFFSAFAESVDLIDMLNTGFIITPFVNSLGLIYTRFIACQYAMFIFIELSLIVNAHRY